MHRGRMQPQTITFLVAGIGVGGSVLTYYLTRFSQEDRLRRDERRQEYRELVKILTKSYMRIISPYDPPIPVIDEALQRQIVDAKLDAFRVLRDRIVIADELKNTRIGDIATRWTEAIVNLEHNSDSITFAHRFTEINEAIITMANRPAPKRRILRNWYYRIRYYRQIRQLGKRS